MKINNKTNVDLLFVKLMMKFENIMSKMMEQRENLRPVTKTPGTNIETTIQKPQPVKTVL